MYDKFYNRLKVEADLIAVSGIHVGAGADSFDPLALTGALLRDEAHTPFIPGSSLKGVLRGCLASIYSEQYDASEKTLSQYLSKESRKRFDTAAALAQEIASASVSSVVHKLFGSSVAAGKVKLSDAYPLETAEAVATSYRKGNAINRETHTVQGTALFDTELIPAGTVFRFRMDADNLTHDEAETLLLLLKYFAEGNIRVGGRSRAGLGEVMLKNIAFSLTIRQEGAFPVTMPVAWDEVLTKLTPARQ